MTKIEKDELLNLNREVLEKIREKVCERLNMDKDKISYLHEKCNHVRFTTEDFSKGFAPIGNHHYEACIHYAQSEDNRASVGIHFEHNNNSLNQAFFAYSTLDSSKSIKDIIEKYNKRIHLIMRKHGNSGYWVVFQSAHPINENNKEKQIEMLVECMTMVIKELSKYYEL